MPPSDPSSAIATLDQFTPAERAQVEPEIARAVQQLSPAPCVRPAKRPKRPPPGAILVSTNDRTMTNVNGRDPMTYRRQVQLFGVRAQASSADKRASFAGNFISQPMTARPNRQQRQAMTSKRFGRGRMIEVPR